MSARPRKPDRAKLADVDGVTDIYKHAASAQVDGCPGCRDPECPDVDLNWNLDVTPGVDSTFRAGTCALLWRVGERLLRVFSIRHRALGPQSPN